MPAALDAHLLIPLPAGGLLVLELAHPEELFSGGYLGACLETHSEE